MKETSSSSSSNKEQRIAINPNPTMVALTETQDITADLNIAKEQLADQLLLTKEYSAKINSLDQEIAHLKDERATLEKQRDSLFKTFQDLYNQYQQLYDQIISSNTALTITTGKLAEALVRYKFTIPKQE